MELRKIKREIRILGVDDARFIRGQDDWTRLVGVIFRGGDYLEGCVQIPIRVDGKDVTSQLTNMITASPHYGQLRLVMTRDTIFGGVNVLNLRELFEGTNLPVIAVSDSKPNMQQVKKALQQIDPSGWEERFSSLEASGPIREVVSRPGRGPVYMQWQGLPFDQAVEVIQNTATRSRIPEPIRVAHLFASSFVSEE
ncbi:MAG: DUF99 family protein [Promethearchaeota archaeon]